MQKKAPVIFLAFANDQQDQARYLRGLAAELRGLREALQPARRAGDVEIVERANASLGDIFDVFQDPEWKGRIKVFHFGGHANSYQLLFEAGRGNAPQAADADALGRFLAGQPGLEFIFLNGCATAQQAIGLRAAGVPAVIATDIDINDEVATRFAIRFYKGIGAYLPVSKAYNDAQQETVSRLDKEEGLRGLYWEGRDRSKKIDQFPWRLYPHEGSSWKLPGGGRRDDKYESRPLVGPYAQFMVNRYEQDNEFTSRFLLTAPARRPKVFIVHGPRDERHESLIKRFSYEYIGGKGYLEPVDIGVWPVLDERQGRTNLRSDLAKAFDGLSWDDRTLQLGALDIVNLPSLRGRQAVVLQHLIPEEKWNQDTEKLLAWYIGTFWNIEVANPESPRPVIFLNVLYDTNTSAGKGLFQRLFGGGWSRQRIVQRLEAIAEQQSENCTLLTELYPVGRNHLEEWLQTTNLVDIEPFLDLPEQLFPQTKSLITLPMLAVERGIKEAIDSYNRKEGLRMM